MPAEGARSPIDPALLDRVSTGLLLFGIVAVFQNAVRPLLWVGLVALALGTLMALVSEVGKRQPWQNVVARLSVIGMIIGILGMLQSWEVGLYANGFTVLALSTLAFIIITHVPTPEA